LSGLGPRHSEVAYLRSLFRDASARRAADVVVLEGARLIDGARTRGAHIEAEYVAEDRGLDVPGAIVLAAGVIEKIADTKSPQGVVAVADDPVVVMTPAALDELGPGTILLAIDINDPGNAGTMIRSAEAAGCAAIVFAGNSVDPRNPKAIRSSAGAIFGVTVLEADDPVEAVAQLRATGRGVIGAVARDGRAPEAAPLGTGSVIAIGSEAHGLRPEVIALLDDTVTIPMTTSAESLNAAMAATLLVFESARQQRASS
jgi:TrmH family RNA methyltransferase